MVCCCLFGVFSCFTLFKIKPIKSLPTIYRIFFLDKIYYLYICFIYVRVAIYVKCFQYLRVLILSNICCFGSLGVYNCINSFLPYIECFKSLGIKVLPGGHFIIVIIVIIVVFILTDGLFVIATFTQLCRTL